MNMNEAKFKSTLILVTGQTGAVKTTYCEALVKSHKAHVFSIDKWMTSLYWQDMPQNPDMNWFVENQKWYTDRIARCEDLIANEIKDLVGLGVVCALDLGFTASMHRKRFIELGEKLGCKVEIHHIDVPSKIRWERVERRNREKTQTYSMQVARSMFDYMEGVFESFSTFEKNLLKVVDGI
ncbi:MAG: ATP-binding protein [Bacteriovoracaceae bacterium]|nr:ATP-binding protein [Bacteriovoracaceae bacterium]